MVKAPKDAKVRNQTHEYWCQRPRGLFLLMRWSGLSIMDALTLPRAKLLNDGGKYRIEVRRTKTGSHVRVVLPPDIAAELLVTPNDNDHYFFWSGQGEKKSICGNWGKRFIAPCFTEAGIVAGHMKAHRLRDTFAVDLLKKGVSIEDVSKLLGHSSLRITEKYYAPWVEGRQDRLDAIVEATWQSAKPNKKQPGRVA